MRRALMAMTVSLLAAVLAHPASAATSDWITDQAGDANFLNGEQTLGSPLVCVSGNCVTAPDPSGDGVATAPLSYGPADIRGLRFETTFTAVPIGDDGIHYQATGVKVSMVLDSVPKSDGPTIIYRVNANVGGACNSFLQAFVRGPSSVSQTDPADLAIQWRQLDATCPDGVKTVTVPFNATIDTAQKAIVLNFAYSKLTAAERTALSTGVALMTPQASTRTFLVALTAPEFDQSSIGQAWVIGSDLPADVPCTTNCP
jgi:hypothetical protein